MKNRLFLSVLIAFTMTGYAQTSNSEKTGFWTQGSSWGIGVMPGTLSSGTITANTLAMVINGTVKTRENINMTLSSLTINAGDTLVVMGNMALYGASSLTNNGVLIVMGNFLNSLSSDVVSSTGKMVVTGNYTNAVGVVNTFTGPSYVYGSKTGFLFAPSVGNESTLTSTDPALHTFVGAMYSSLPVELLSFSARVYNDETLITWKTASEINNDYFTVERSIDGRNFDVIVTLTGSGTSKQIHTYQYADPSQFIGYTYYRLSQSDYDGKKTVFRVISVNKVVAKMTIYPNPTTDQLFFNTPNENYIVSVNDVNGVQRILSQRVAEISPKKFGLDISALEPGFYYLSIVNATNSEKQVYTFIKK